MFENRSSSAKNHTSQLPFTTNVGAIFAISVRHLRNTGRPWAEFAASPVNTMRSGRVAATIAGSRSSTRAEGSEWMSLRCAMRTPPCPAGSLEVATRVVVTSTQRGSTKRP